MAFTTAQDIVDKALKKIGISSPTSLQQTDALDALNALLASWSIEGVQVPLTIRESFALTIGKADYTIGSGGDFDTARPISIVRAYIRDSNNYDTDLNVEPMTEYDSITSKSEDGKPTELYYYPSYPLGKIYLDYEPDEAYTLYLISIKYLSEFSGLSTSISLPPEYRRALVFNLAVDLASDEDYQLPQEVFIIAETTKQAIFDEAVSHQIPPDASFDNAIVTTTTYNIYTDS